MVYKSYDRSNHEMGFLLNDGEEIFCREYNWICSGIQMMY